MKKTSRQISTTSSFSREKLIVPAFIAVVLLYWMGLYLYSPTLPLYAQDKTDNLALVGVVLSMYGLWQLIARLPAGIGVDWAGWRKPFIVVGLFIVAASALVMAYAQDITMLAVGRALSGVAAATWVPLVVMFSSLYTPGQVLRSMGVLSLVNSLGRISATALSGVLNSLGGYTLAFHLAALAALIAIGLIFLVPDKRQPSKRPSFNRLGRLFVNPLVLIPSLLSCLLHYGDWSTWASFTPILARNFGANDVMVSLLVTLEMVFVLVGNLVSTAIVNKIGYRKMLYASFLLLAIGIAGAALAPSLGLIYGSQAFIGLAFGIAYPVLLGLSINRVEPELQNSAMGLHQSVYALGMFAGPWLSGLLAAGLGIQSMFGITAAVILVLGLVGGKQLKN